MVKRDSPQPPNDQSIAKVLGFKGIEFRLVHTAVTKRASFRFLKVHRKSWRCNATLRRHVGDDRKHDDKR